MSRNQRWPVLGTGVFLVAAALALGGCAAQGPVKPAGLEQKIEAARTRADHDEIAAVYEQQAEGHKAASEWHRRWARAYEQGIIRQGTNRNNVAHCDNLVRIFQQASEVNLALAREHRQMAAEMKD